MQTLTAGHTSSGPGSRRALPTARALSRRAGFLAAAFLGLCAGPGYGPVSEVIQEFGIVCSASTKTPHQRQPEFPICLTSRGRSPQESPPHGGARLSYI